MTVNLHTRQIRKCDLRRMTPRRLKLCLPIPGLLMSILGLLILCSGVRISLADDSTAQIRSPAGVLGKKTAWATPWYVVEGAEPGPVVFLTGGMHGNEPAGSQAAESIRHWPIRRGRLIVVPRINHLGLNADIRWFPPLRNEKPLRDMNRNFPTAEQPMPRTPLAEALWELIRQHSPDFVVDLHEGFDFHISNSKSVGSSVICSASERRSALAKQMLSAVNAGITDESLRFELLSRSGAVTGSMVRAATDVLKTDAFILETTFKDQPLSLRTRQHRLMVSTLFRQIGLIDEACQDVLTAREAGRVNVALFDGEGASSNGLKNLTRVVGGEEDLSVTRVGPADMQPEILRQFHVVLFPGGSGSRQGKAIGKTGREAVRGFAQTGGGIVGVCAGAYLCSSHYDWSLHVINTAVFNKTVEIPGVGRKSMWFRGGPQDVDMELAAAAESVLGRAGDVKVRFQNGPIISPGKDTDLPDYTPLAWFRSEVVRYDPQKGTMVDTPAIVSAPFGDGRILSVSPHPEATPGLEPLIVRGIRWSARSQPSTVKADP